MAKPPRIAIPGLNRGAGIPPGYVLGRRQGTGQGPAELLNLIHLRSLGVATAAGATQSTSQAISIAHSETVSLSTAVSGSLSTNASAITSLSTAVSTVDSGQAVSLSQISNSLSGAISSTSSLSTAVSTVISGSISAVNSAISSLSTAGGGGGGPDPGQSTSLSQISSSLSGAISVNTGQSTSLSQISSSLSGAISSTTSLSTAVSTVDSNQNSSISANLSLATSLSATMVGDSGSGGTKGLVPAPATGDATKFLKGDGTWGTPSGGGSSALTRIAKVTTTGSATSISFTSIPGTYSDLILVLSGRSATTAISDNFLIRLNGDSGSNYNSQRLNVVNTTASGSQTLTGTSFNIGGLPAASATASYAGQSHIEFVNYAGTTFFKSAAAFGGDSLSDSSSATECRNGGGLWKSASAITQIDIILNSGSNFVDGTTAVLYGRG